MRKIIIIFIFSLFSLHTLNSIKTELKPDYSIKRKEIKIECGLEKLFKAVSAIESNFNPYALNEYENAVGIVQIRPIRLKDFNIRTGKNYLLEDMYDISKAKEVFMYYANKYKGNIEKIARNWNGGPTGYKKESTLKYWNKVKSKL